MSSPKDGKQDSTDILLLLGGLVVAGVGLSWLLLSKPWELLSSDERMVVPPVLVATAEPTVKPRTTEPALETTLDNPLKMARLAFEAGMLIEPAGFSAWSLYERVLEDTPEQPDALDGLTLIADSLVARGAVALEQGRVNDVRDIVEHILDTLPDHDGAAALAAELGEPVVQTDTRSAVISSPPAPSIVEAKPAVVAIVETPQIIASPAVETPAPEPPPVDPLVELGEAFDQAMADNRLLTPIDENAAHFLNGMLELDPEAEVVLSAHGRIFDEFIRRASVATETMDATAAATWIDAAESVNGDAVVIEQARERLTSRLVQAESMKPFPASQLEMVEYSAPRYPMRASSRSLEGWVDVEFFVTTEGTTRDISITDASHEAYFRESAVTAVERWQFEPRVFMGQVIEQRVYTRLRFDLE